MNKNPLGGELNDLTRTHLGRLNIHPKETMMRSASSETCSSEFKIRTQS